MWSPPPESNRRPHPYHGTTRNRCAERRFPSSRPTVRVKIIGSPSMKLCAHFSVMLFVIGARYPSERSANPLGVPCWVGHLFWRMASVDGAVWVLQPQHHNGVRRLPNRRAVNLNPRDRDPASGHTQMKASDLG